jgi:hypothetical protein
MRVPPVPAGTTTVVLVEGVSDREAVLTLAGRCGIDLAERSVAVVAMGGATNAGHHVRELGPGGRGLRLLVLCDEHEARHVSRALDAGGVPAGALHVCRRDLEDEVIRTLGTEAVLTVVADRGDLPAFRILQRQPAHRDRPVDQQLRRFLGTRAGRKQDYGAALAAVLPLDALPDPLSALLARLRG